MEKIKDDVSQHIIQQEIGCIEEQEPALNDIIVEHMEEIAERTAEEV